MRINLLTIHTYNEARSSRVLLAKSMIEKSYIEKHLSEIACYKCGKALSGTRLTPISEVPVALIAHAKCANCGAESMITITVGGSGAMPMVSDLAGNEIKKFIGAKNISVDELLDLHLILKGKSICKLLRSQETSLAKTQKNLEETSKSLP